MVDDELRAALDAIEAQWNSAEEYVKRVERLRRGLVVGASINEFRYAGRRVVEAYALAKRVPAEPELRPAAFDLLREVKHFCMRAQHDAMDAAVTYIDQALAKFEDEFGPDLLHEKFPNYLLMKRSLQEVSEIMAQSRGNRELRDGLYQGIRDDLVPSLIDQHHELETSSTVLEAAFGSRVRKDRTERGRFWLTIVVGVIAAVAAVAALYPIFFDKKPETRPPPTAAASSAAGEPKS